MTTQQTFASPILGSVLSILSSVHTHDISDSDTLAQWSAHPSSKYAAMSPQSRNRCAIQMVEEIWSEQGYFAGWKHLATIASPSLNLPIRLVPDVLRCLAVYDTIHAAYGPRPASDGLRMAVTRSSAARDSIYCVGPKSIGGTAWMRSDEYNAAHKSWSPNTAFAPMSPCTSFAWLGAQRKAIAREDLDVCDAFTLLGM